MRTATLRGFEHVVLGGVSCIAEDRLALAISRGGAKKTYAHRDPNEDACGFAASEYGHLLVVADGHAGCDAAQIAVEHFIDRLAPQLLGEADPGLAGDWQKRAVELALEIHNRILQGAEIAAEHPPRTTLAVALARPREDRLGWIHVGDSLIFRAHASGVESLGAGRERVRYLGSPRDDREGVARGVEAGTTALAGTRALVLATDGLSEQGIGVAEPERAVEQALAQAAQAQTADLRPLDAARRLAEIANQSHREQKAGDNIATAVAWLDD